MKKIDLGQAVSTIANIGVIAGIVFLAIELRQNNALLRSQTLFNHVQLRLEHGVNLNRNERVAEIMVKKNAGQELTPVEEIMLRDEYQSVFVGWEWEWREHARGQLEVLPIYAYRRALTGETPDGDPIYPGMLEAWEVSKAWSSDDFAAFVDNEVLATLPD